MFIVAAFWGVCAFATIVIFALDERAHRRQAKAPAQPVAAVPQLASETVQLPTVNRADPALV